jgi:hypothetical protein
VSFLTLLPLALVMIAGPQILTVVFLARPRSSVRPLRLRSVAVDPYWAWNALRRHETR